MKKSDFDFYLPEELIAQTPLEKRDSSRLLVLDKETGGIEHRHFYELVDFLQENDCLVMNNSRVLPARLLGERESGGAVELVLLRDLGNNRWECLSRPGRKTSPAQSLLSVRANLPPRLRPWPRAETALSALIMRGFFLKS